MGFSKIKDYYCGYCNHFLKKDAKATLTEEDKYISNQIICPKCGNFLPTWDDKAERKLAEMEAPKQK